MSTRSQEESRDEMILRLAQRARESGVRIIRDRRDGRFYASSASCPGLWHYTTAVSCDCKGFASHGRCMHHSALLVALGWAGEGDPEPEVTIGALPVPTITCETCDGRGSVHGTVPTSATTWTYSDIVCPDCHGRGEFTCPTCQDSGITEVVSDFIGQSRTVCRCDAGQLLTVHDLTVVERETGTPVYLNDAA